MLFKLHSNFLKIETFWINNLEIALYLFAHFLFLNHNFLTEKIVMQIREKFWFEF